MVLIASVIGVIGVILPCFIIQCVQWSKEKEETYGFGTFCGGFIVVLIILEMICVCEIVSEPQPSAMDVYQGKTTIEYTIRNGVKVDSVVVFKENYYGKD